MDPRKFPAKPRTMERRSDQRRAPRTPPLRSRRTFRAATANPDSRELEKLLTSRALRAARAVGARLRRGPLAPGVHGGLAEKGARVWIEGGGAEP